MTDEALRRRALDFVGPLGDALAREALEHGEVIVAPAGVAWEGSLGTVQGHRVLLRASPEIHARLVAEDAPALTAKDALQAALAAALAERAGHALADLAFEEGARRAPGGGPYRG